MSYSRTLKTLSLVSASALMSSAAFADCGHTCSTSHSSSVQPLSSWSSSHYSPAPTHYSSSSHSVGNLSSSATSYRTTSYGASTANCPSGTTPQSDGTCLDTSGSYSSTSSYNTSSYSVPSSSTYSSGSSYTGSSSVITTPSYSTSSTYSTSPVTSYSSASPSYSTSTYTSAPSSTSSYVPSSSTYSASSVTSYSSASPSYSTSTYTTAPSSTSSYSIASPSYASSAYGSGSISQSYSDSNMQVIPFTSTASVPGLGANESLVPTSCPVNVYNPGGAKVLGCYSVSKPKPMPLPRVNYTRVVRPVVYVRYPVPTPVPYIQDVYVGHYNYGGCGAYTRYGAGYPGSCGW